MPITTGQTVIPADEKIRDTAARIRTDWTNISPAAAAHLVALENLDTLTDTYGVEDADTRIRYFLANAGTWRGSVARAVKAHLKQLVGIK